MRAANSITATGKDRVDVSTTIIAGTATGIAIGEIAGGIVTGIGTATRLWDWWGGPSYFVVCLRQGQTTRGDRLSYLRNGFLTVTELTPRLAAEPVPTGITDSVV